MDSSFLDRMVIGDDMPEKNYFAEYFVVLVWGFLGLVGGMVRCFEEGKFSYRRMAASLSTAAFAGAVSGAVFHNMVADPMMLGALCAMSGYSGQLALILLIKWAKKRAGIL
jgi:hypothetical protein